jgi:hypothetical protein
MKWKTHPKQKKKQVVLARLLGFAPLWLLRIQTPNATNVTMEQNVRDSILRY